MVSLCLHGNKTKLRVRVRLAHTPTKRFTRLLLRKQRVYLWRLLESDLRVERSLRRKRAKLTSNNHRKPEDARKHRSAVGPAMTKRPFQRWRRSAAPSGR